MAFTGSLTKGPSFDETLQLAVGYNLWLHDDYRLEGANGDLVKRWTTLPYLASRPEFINTADQRWKSGSGYELGQAFFFELGNSPESLLRQARAMNVLLGVAAGLVVFCCAREMFGRAGGLVALAFFVFSPSMLAFGGLVSTDMSITLTLVAATCAVWRLLHRVTMGWAVGSLCAVALLVLAKPTALVLFPIALVLVMVNLVGGQTTHVRWRSRTWSVQRVRSKTALFAGLAALHLLAGWAALWAHYGFRYEASPNPADPTIQFFQRNTTDSVPPALVGVLRWTEENRILPEGFRRGIEALLLCDDKLGAFMNGQWKMTGWRWFFPYAIWVKTPPSLFLGIALGIAAWWWALRTRNMPRNDEKPRPLGFLPSAMYVATPHLTLVGCYLAVAMTENINIGHRHVLPIYPSLYVLAGGMGLAWSWGRWGKLIAILPLAWIATDSFAIRPHYLAYFGAQAGGPEQGYKHLVDSSLDWGMDLPGLKRWLDEQAPQRREPLFLAYFGTDDPAHHGIDAIRLPGFMPSRTFGRYALRPGYYAISASLLQAAHTAAFGPWSKAYEELYQQLLQNVVRFASLASDPARQDEILKIAPMSEWNANYYLFDELRFARLCAWLRHRGKPPHHIGHAMFIWKLSAEDLREALLGPPVELTDRPTRLRVYRFFPREEEKVVGKI